MNSRFRVLLLKPLQITMYMIKVRPKKARWSWGHQIWRASENASQRHLLLGVQDSQVIYSPSQVTLRCIRTKSPIWTRLTSFVFFSSSMGYANTNRQKIIITNSEIIYTSFSFTLTAGHKIEKNRATSYQYNSFHRQEIHAYRNKYVSYLCSYTWHWCDKVTRTQNIHQHLTKKGVSKDIVFC